MTPASKEANPAKVAKAFMEEEEKASGSVALEIYKRFIEPVGVKYLVLAVISNLLVTAGAVGSPLVLAYWTSSSRSFQLILSLSLYGNGYISRNC